VSDWNPAEIQRLAEVSGRPLEVRCAEAFRAAGWRVLLSTYYIDAVSEKTRELDVLVERRQLKTLSPDGLQGYITVRGLISVKGFPPDHCPIGYSVATTGLVPELALLGSHRTLHYRGELPVGLAKRGGAFVSTLGPLNGTRPVTGMDVCQRRPEAQRRAGGKGQPEKVPPYERKRDADLYDGLDSAIKAAAFWSEVPLWSEMDSLGTGQRHAAVNVPILVLAQPFWDIALDGGTASLPMRRLAGYHVGWFAFPGILQRPSIHMQPVMSLIWAIEEVPALVRIMGALADWIGSEPLEL
jgi:hypothetical protein